MRNTILASCPELKDELEPTWVLNKNDGFGAILVAVQQNESSCTTYFVFTFRGSTMAMILRFGLTVGMVILQLERLTNLMVA